MKKLLLPALLLLGITGCLTSRMLPDNTNATASGKDWREYLGGPDRNHYSTLKQITPDNVGKLRMAWEYHTLDSGQIQCNPIIVDGILYAMTATTQPFAVDAATGQEKWRLKPTAESNGLSTSRGVTYWENGDDKRILYTNGPWLYALDARTGQAITSFGENGRTSLKAGLGETAKDKFVISNTPGTVYNDLIIMPMRLSEGADAALGHIQAFDIRTGKLAWVFRTIPQPGEFGYETWPPDTYKNTDVGGGNNWSGMSVDRKRGILYVPTGSAAFDFYGGNRKGQNLFANCLLALDANTGKRLWHYQLVHHDILDRDAPAPPNLLTVKHNGKMVDAVAQVTKQGYIFMFDRVTGEPLFPIEERPVPATDVPEEEAWPTQPFPVKPAPYARQSLTETDLNPYAENLDELKATLQASRNEAGPFTPLSKKGTIIFPGLDGGAEWGGAAVDPDGVMYLNSNEMAWLLALKTTAPDANVASLSSGERLYASNCTPCHGAERKGNPASGYPSLIDIQKHRTTDYVTNVVAKGKGMMPAFTKLSAEEKKALVAFLFGTEKVEPGITKLKEPGLEKKAGMPDVPYRISGYTKFLDKKGYPAIKPPWGTLNAIDLNTGEYRWKITYGETPELAAKGLPQTGSESYGGPVVTASGLLFIAGTKDGKFRAYDKKTGKLLWETTLPAAAFATPSTYEVNGKQYLVLACGGTKLGARKGDSYVAFALPD
ncbi:PQQ-binding-like beta-propeller repeat protein [Adhaeribacter swui]|uniref:PQQ-binding-like beta-propeller repeat protein n=1 Tax=Adhaeribacter swui TaxID=2086471 RepID=A0A7G7G3C8_9BACT|nr:PQQ-binding-like beta-propeller repeat protein [Adhaeribacter swui]QNF31662.1 PQQ-binding-like beta-propeller repeat protein [Adhaeribacter swui]